MKTIQAYLANEEILQDVPYDLKERFDLGRSLELETDCNYYEVIVYIDTDLFELQEIKDRIIEAESISINDRVEFNYVKP